MALYRADKGIELLWRVEADMRGMKAGCDFRFVDVGHALTLSKASNFFDQDNSKLDFTGLHTAEHSLYSHIIVDWTDREKKAKEQGRNLFSGPLAHMFGITRSENGGLDIALGKTDYAAHHATTPLQGKHTAWTLANNPKYKIKVIDSKLAQAVFDNPESLGTAFAAAILPVTNDGKLIYGIRNIAVDCYQQMWSLPSGGRFSGNPHEAVDELIYDASNINQHVTDTLALEFAGMNSMNERVHDIKPLGIFRANDYDVTIAYTARVDADSHSLERSFSTNKYSGAGSFEANSAGMVKLLRELGHFPPSIQGVIGLAAAEYGVDVTDRPSANMIMISHY
jgi:hypothetical protein